MEEIKRVGKFTGVHSALPLHCIAYPNSETFLLFVNDNDGQEDTEEHLILALGSKIPPQ